MDKQGHSLRTIPEFTDSIIETLRDQLSVSTAEEFVQFASRYPADVSKMIEVDLHGLEELYHSALEVLSPEERELFTKPAESQYPFATGHDAPVEADTFYKRNRGNDRS